MGRRDDEKGLSGLSFRFLGFWLLGVESEVHFS
jgi:hypothetical protein